MSHVGLSLIVMPVSQLNFQFAMLKHVSLLLHAQLCFAALIVVADTAFALSCHRMCDVMHTLVKLHVVNCHFTNFCLDTAASHQD
jgi:hypothetical protein